MIMIDYYILNPTGNITALVTNNNILPDSYAEISNAIMKRHNDVEQVGFIDINGKTPKLRMSGGEFCGNATMCTASLFSELNDVTENNLLVEVYGVEKFMPVSISKNENGYDCIIQIPKPKNLYEMSFEIDNESFVLPIVEFNGISHIIANNRFDKKTAERIIKKYCDILNCKAMGIMLLNDKTYEMVPIVYVKKGNTLFYENSCASGSSAVCYYLTKDSNIPKEFILKQPGGNLTVSSSSSLDYIILKGNVIIINHFNEEI